jgi:hypothetical protein
LRWTNLRWNWWISRWFDLWRMNSKQPLQFWNTNPNSRKWLIWNKWMW